MFRFNQNAGNGAGGFHATPQQQQHLQFQQQQQQQQLQQQYSFTPSFAQPPQPLQWSHPPVNPQAHSQHIFQQQPFAAPSFSFSSMQQQPQQQPPASLTSFSSQQALPPTAFPLQLQHTQQAPMTFASAAAMASSFSAASAAAAAAASCSATSSAPAKTVRSKRHRDADATADLTLTADHLLPSPLKKLHAAAAAGDASPTPSTARAMEDDTLATPRSLDSDADEPLASPVSDTASPLMRPATPLPMPADAARDESPVDAEINTDEWNLSQLKLEVAEQFQPLLHHLNSQQAKRAAGIDTDSSSRASDKATAARALLKQLQLDIEAQHRRGGCIRAVWDRYDNEANRSTLHEAGLFTPQKFPGEASSVVLYRPPTVCDAIRARMQRQSQCQIEEVDQAATVSSPIVTEAGDEDDEKSPAPQYSAHSNGASASAAAAGPFFLNGASHSSSAMRDSPASSPTQTPIRSKRRRESDVDLSPPAALRIEEVHDDDHEQKKPKLRASTSSADAAYPVLLVPPPSAASASSSGEAMDEGVGSAPVTLPPVTLPSLVLSRGHGSAPNSRASTDSSAASAFAGPQSAHVPLQRYQPQPARSASSHSAHAPLFPHHSSRPPHDLDERKEHTPALHSAHAAPSQLAINMQHQQQQAHSSWQPSVCPAMGWAGFAQPNAQLTQQQYNQLPLPHATGSVTRTHW